VVAGASELQNNDNQHDELLKRLLQDLSVKKAAQLASDITGTKKNALYERALILKEHLDE
jgi:16S rRNA (cytidine1402-2'-O)-methyltransferase